MAWEILEPFGPDYNVDGAGLKAFRRAARKGLSALSRDERQAYGAAVEAAVLTQQRAAFLRAAGVTDHNAPCASGTWASDGAAIHAHMRRKQRAAILAAPSQIRRAREPDVWRAMYAEAMAERRERERLAA